MEEYQPTAGEKAAQYVFVTLILVLILGSALLARRQMRLGRGDRRGALKLAVLAWLGGMLHWALGIRHIPNAYHELVLFLSGLGLALLLAAVAWTLYLALEPFARRTWPQMLISWNRVLAGRFRDPVVGRDLLIGCLIGAAWPRYYTLGWALDQALGHPPAWPNLTTQGLLGVRDAAHDLFTGLLWSGVFPLAYLFFLVLFRKLLRRQWLAATATFLVFSAGGLLGAPEYSPSLLLIPLFGAVQLLVLMRLGLLAELAVVAVSGVLSAFPVTATLSTWYAGYGVFAMVAVAALAFYAFRVSLAGRPMLGGALQEE
jgi:serine/threonine-protein kinase